MKEYNLLPQPEGYTYDYDPSINPGILNEFATAVYRFHTLIQVSQNNSVKSSLIIKIQNIRVY